MPVSTSLGEPRAKRCKHCDESTHCVDGPASWKLTLDQDLVDTLKGIYPEWFKSGTGMAEGERPSPPASTPPPLVARLSPPKAVVDASPLQPSMDKNKESLKVKLMLRRPINQLVDQGIMPPLKTPPAFHEQRKQLERAKTGDLLKAKIQQRPDRQELERRHILEQQEGHVDPSLAERQRMLKKARLADQLNDQLSHRPGPLELIKKNILHTEEPIERAVKEGLVPFRATCEGQLTRPQHPSSYITYEDDSQSSEGDLRTSPPRPDVLETAAASAGIVTVALTIPTTGGAVVVTSAPVFQTKFPQNILQTSHFSVAQPTHPIQIKAEPIHIKSEPIQIKAEPGAAGISFAELCQSVTGGPPTLLPLAPAPSPVSLASTTSSLSPLSSVSSPPAHTPITPRPTPSPLHCQRSDAPGKDKNRKKSKSKTVPKTRTIKFHEYKGPPNAQKSAPISTQAGETSYELLLQQQQLFLQWQLNWQHKYPQIILPAAQKPMVLSETSNSASQSSASPQSLPSLAIHSPAAPSPASTINEPTSVLRPLGKLEDMKVSDLKIELKRRNLQVSGPKPQLIERLKPFLAQSESVLGTMAETPTPLSMCSEESISGENCEIDNSLNSPQNSMSPESEHDNMEIQADSPHSIGGRNTPGVQGDDIVREQQRKIEELQRELHKSQLQLQQIRHQQPVTNLATRQEPKNQKLALQQHLHAKIHTQKLTMHLQQLQQLQNLQAQQTKQQQENQQRQQKEHLAFQQGLNAKNQTNLLLSQSPVVTTASIGTILTQQPKIENSITINNNPIQVHNKKNLGIVLNGQQATLVLNQLGLHKAKLINGHQRTASLPTFLVPANLIKSEPPEPEESEVKPPPQYEEATKQLKKPEGKSHIKSQIVDDVLEILIKNGELPPSAAQDPATPTTPGTRAMNQALVYQATSEAEPPPPPPLPHTTFAVTLPTSISLNSPQSIVSLGSPLHSSHLNEPQNSPNSLDGSLCNIQLAMVDNTEIVHHRPDTLEMLLGQAPSGHEPGLDLKELGLDLETLDSMDFGQLDCDKLDHELDMEIGADTPQTSDPGSIESYVNDYVTNVSSNLSNSSPHREMNPTLQPSLIDIMQNNIEHMNGYHSPLNENNNLSHGLSHSLSDQQPEFMDIGDMPMEMDEWLDSLMPPSSELQPDTGPMSTPPHPFLLAPSHHVSPSTHLAHHHGVDIDDYDPLLATNQDAFDLFGMDELKMHGTPLSWDKVDFAT